MLEEQQGKNYQLADQLALKEDQITQLQRALELRKAEMQGQLSRGNVAVACMCTCRGGSIAS